MHTSPYFALALCIVILCHRRGVREYVLRIWSNGLSWAINLYLNRRYTVLSIDGVASRGIPTCPYKWPNGQGDVAKFLEGEDNSSRWFKEHGRIYRLWAGMSPEMYVLAHLDALNNYLIRTHNPVTNMSTLTRDRVLTQSQDVKSVFKDSDLHTKAVNNDAGWLMGQLLGKCMGLVTGSEWRKSRASVGEHFTFKSTSQFIPRIVEITEAYFSDLHDDGRLRSHALLTPSKDLRLLPFWVVAEYIYGPLTPHARDQLESLIPLRESLFRTVIQGGMTRFKWGSWLPSPTNRCLQEFKEKWRKLNDDIYEESKRSDRSRVLGHMYESIHESGTSLENVLQTVDEMLFGNIDVTVGALSWIPILLAAAPTFTAELHEEIMTEERNNTGWAAYLARSDSLLTYSILEAAPAPETRVASGYSVPGGTNFVVDTRALNIRDPYWGPDGSEYCPSRFRNKNLAEMRYHYWRFGFGPRQCLGKYIADFILRSIVAHLVKSYTLSLLPSSNWDKNPETWIAQSAAAIRCERRTSLVSHGNLDEKMAI
ncbi:cytochrome P450 [Nemania serpens]|nr:cytochrome P450 [Nemania serpens]